MWFNIGADVRLLLSRYRIGSSIIGGLTRQMIKYLFLIIIIKNKNKKVLLHEVSFQSDLF